MVRGGLMVLEVEERGIEGFRGEKKGRREKRGGVRGEEGRGEEM